ncbi:MAG TPA: isoleucine--tRNA ligase [Dehalococcoidia bacterium]|nr:isoleucine--tRNA ligase [Dehalococcoidia bacterium]
MLQPVTTRPDFVADERRTLAWWRERDMIRRYIARNAASEKRWSFIDGPITANNPMGVHHAWGRSYKDLYQRFHTMLGERQRYQNGFDCQGLWIEVEVEKEHGFTSKKDILDFGIDKFVEECKARVQRFAAVQTEQSTRLGYWMDWDHSYYTNSDENNYTIWGFLKTCWEKGWLYKGHDVMPWCPRCATGLSEHEIVTEGYKELTHVSVYLKFPLADAPGESLLVWTTTPWTLAGNVAAAVHPALTYLRVRSGDDVVYVSKGAAKSALKPGSEVLGEVPGSALIGRAYAGPFDELPAQQGVAHRVVAWDEVSEEEGTGIVHIAPGCGKEDFALSKEHGLAVIAPTDDEGVYLDGFAWLTGKYVSDEDARDAIFASLREKGVLYRTQAYSHRYPVCWRCGTELIFRLVDEWFISMDELRHQIAGVTRQIRWIPEFGLARELDWLKNMDDWMISKKRYYGLALPIFDCAACGSFEVIGSETELQARAVSGWEQFEGHSPHKPWIDAVTIACATCGETVTRIPDVGNPWLDAGIVPFSTLGYRHDRAYWEAWFPAQFITEAFPGQFRNWFYSLLTMSTALVNRPPFLTVLGHAMVRDEHGEEMHKSKGNAIWFDDAADSMGVDVMRWLFFRQNPANNINFGYGPADEVRRGMFLTLWNTYVFFVTYARIDGWTPAAGSGERSELDRWVRSELHQLIEQVTERLHDFDAAGATRHVERFIDGLSNWYVRRSRRRFWKSESDTDKLAAYATLYECLTMLTRLLAPFVPFLAEAMHQNLVRGFDEAAPESVHLADWPDADAAAIDRRLSEETRLVMRVASLGRAARAKAQIKVRQPVAELFVKLPSALEEQAIERLAPQVLDELNVKALRVVRDEADFLRFEVKPNLKLLGQKYGREVQDIAKALAAMGDRERAEVARRVGAGQAVEVAGKTLAPEEVLVAGREREGFASAEEGGIVVIVSSELTPELVREGTAREIVHRIQNLRKDAGFEIADRIRTYYRAEDGVEAHAALRDVVGAWGDYIRQETLSVDLSDDAPPHGVHSETAEIDGQRVTLAVVRV